MLEVLAIDRVDDAVGANELDSTVNVDIYHRATLTVLGEEGDSPQVCHRRPHPDIPYALHSPTKQLSSKQEWEHKAQELGRDGDEGLTVERMCRTTSRGTTERSSSFSCKENMNERQI